MKEYPKIETLFNRDEREGFKFRVIEGQWRLPEFEYLKDNIWYFTEKVDGTNIRVVWNGQKVEFKGRTDEAQTPPFLLTRLQELFPQEKMLSLYPEQPMCLYGEGYGAKIQKGVGNYNPKGVDFVLFDVLIGDLWLERGNMEDIAGKLGIKVVPIVGEGPLSHGVSLVRYGIPSQWGPFQAEGIVMHPKVSLLTRRGERVIAKLKTNDFK